MDRRRVFTFLTDQQERGLRCVLVTVLAVEGSSMRDPGSHMAVCEDGRFAGSLSGGCIENAVVGEALESLQADCARIVRFGEGSAYLDIKLPCGGGLDIHFQPLRSSALAASSLAAMDQRTPFSIILENGETGFAKQYQSQAYDAASQSAAFGHWPEAKLLIVGHGASVAALAAQASGLGLKVDILTPDDRLIRDAEDIRGTVSKLHRATETGAMRSDPWTAIVFLFHDHDWEIALMKRALELPHFYLGAMGGRRAHAVRSAALADAGAGPKKVASIRAPIGLFHSSRDPDTLALSTLAQIVREYQVCAFERPDG